MKGQQHDIRRVHGEAYNQQLSGARPKTEDWEEASDKGLWGPGTALQIRICVTTPTSVPVLGDASEAISSGTDI